MLGDILNYYSEELMSEQEATPAEAPEAPVASTPEPAQEAAPAPEPAAEAQPEEKAPPEEEEKVDLLGDEAPHWLKEFDARDKPFKVSKEQMDALPMEAKQLIHNLRKMALDKTRAAAEERKGLTSREAEYEEKVASLNHDKAKLYEIFQNEELQKLLKPPTGEAPPSYTEEGQQWRAEKYVSEMMSKIVGKMTNLSEAAHLDYKQAEKQRTVNTRVAELKEFSKANPDFRSYKDEIVKYRKEHPSVSSEDVYYMLKAKSGKLVDPAAKEDPVETIKRARREVRSRLSKTISSDAEYGTLRPPSGLSARQKAEWYRKNPTAANLVMKQIRGT